MTLALATGFVYRCGFLERTAVAFLGVNDVDAPAPVVMGDTITLDVAVVETKTPVGATLTPSSTPG